MNLIRIEPPMHLLTPLGTAEAHFLQVPEGDETHPLWCCFQDETKECWWWPNPLVRLVSSVSGLRDGSSTAFYISDEYRETLQPHIERHARSPLHGRS